VRPLDAPALADDADWPDARTRGTVLHDTFERFMRQMGERRPTEADEGALLAVLRARLDEHARRLAPPNAALRRAAERALAADARVFLRAEAARPEGTVPHAHEMGFGIRPHEAHADDPAASDDRYGRLALRVDDGCRVRLRGWIDRVDRRPDGTFAIWDYKTGSSRSFLAHDPLQDGTTLQWALYAYAFEQVMAAEEPDATVSEAGYVFTSVAEMGRRVAHDPAAHRAAVANVLRHLATLARTGTFPPNPKASAWRYDYARLAPNLCNPKAKAWPEGRPLPAHLA
jgi:RecB family exonuclease